MSVVSLFSAPEEDYTKHISSCREKFEILFPVFLPITGRVFDTSTSDELLKECFLKMIIFHDLGKLSRRWQENIGKNKQLPSHSTLGAAHLWKTLPDGIKEPLSFAVAIHHTDKGLLGDNIERPDVQAILDGIVDNDGRIKWASGVENLEEDFFPRELNELRVEDLKDMAIGLRIWAKGCGLLEQHQRRLQACLAHHILKLCDISAAAEREECEKRDVQDYYGGRLMVEKIKNYVKAIRERALL